MNLQVANVCCLPSFVRLPGGTLGEETLIAIRTNPPRPPVLSPGLNNSKYLSIGTASKISLTNMPVQQTDWRLSRDK